MLERFVGKSRMKRFSAFIIVVAACGQMYRKPGDPDPQAAQAAQLPASPPSEPSQPAPTEPAAVPVKVAPASAKTIAQRFVDAHDRVRAQHCAAPLTWSPKLAAVAQKWADSLRDQGCKFGHSGGQYGENLAAGTEGVLDPEATVKMWYDEIAKYKFPDGGFSMDTGHFTQVVWRGTTQVGCGHSSCNGNDIWVCNYDPAGNWEGQYRENVLPLGCK
jgi:uncharacterized protein YkwD